jgi:hypothetical protein
MDVSHHFASVSFIYISILSETNGENGTKLDSMVGWPSTLLEIFVSYGNS